MLFNYKLLINRFNPAEAGIKSQIETLGLDEFDVSQASRSVLRIAFL